MATKTGVIVRNDQDDHKRHAPSSASQHMACPGSLAMVEALPESERKSGDSLASRRGTSAHSVGEMSLNAHMKTQLASDPSMYLGMEVEGVIVDEAIVDGVKVYTEFCEGLLNQTPELAEIEVTQDMKDLLADFHAGGKFLRIEGKNLGGTADFVAGFFMGKLLIVDYKNGRIMVEAENNKQLLDYAAQTLRLYGEEFDFDEIVMVIVQPNAPHPEGFIRSWSQTPEQVREYMENERLPSIELNLMVVDLLKAGKDITEYLVPGEEQCRWCAARSKCSAANEKLGVIGIGFDDTDPFAPVELLLPNPHFMSEEQRQLILNHGNEIIDFINEVKNSYALKAEHTGETPYGWKLVAKNTHRKVKPGMEKQATKALNKLGLRSVDFLTPPKLVTPPNIEKAMKAKGVSTEAVAEFATEYFIKPEGGHNLVPENKPGKPLLPAIEADFAELYDEEDLLA